MGRELFKNMKKTALINVVGLSKKLVGERMPFLSSWAKSKTVSTIDPVLPAVTCSVQTTYLTGKWPSEHGIVGNGWYFKEEQEVKLWRQSNKLVKAPSIWDNAKKINPSFTCANMFWWYNMHSSVDYSVTPRPQYRANGLKIPDCYSSPAGLRDNLQDRLGRFPLFNFWGPKASIKSSEWIAEASLYVQDNYNPDLLLVYLPHLDYALQKYGHDGKFLIKDLTEIDNVLKRLVSELERIGLNVFIISEYGISNVDHPIHINRILRENGYLSVRTENGLELMDTGASSVFSLSDHQVAHLYFKDHSKLPDVEKLLGNHPRIDRILDKQAQKDFHLSHDRSGDLVAVAKKGSWFTYYYWLSDKSAPDFARTVDIHKKPGYDPVEMFLDPRKPLLAPRIMLKLLAKKMGFRTVMDFIPLNACLVKGSHGRIDLEEEEKAVFIGDHEADQSLNPTSIHDMLLESIFNEQVSLL